jgi:putative hydrolase of the HAD superfamily
MEAGKRRGRNVKYQAVIFDLYGTLVDKISLHEHKKTLEQMALIISAAPDDFTKFWFATFNERGLGIFQNIKENIRYISRKLDLPTEDAKITHAAEINIEYTARATKLRPYAVELLKYLKSNGYKTGLISDCGAEIPIIFSTTPLAPLIDQPIFSCLVGVQKPDPRIYQITVKRLAVKPKDCLYIGDGDSNELTGALKVGMIPILIRNSDEVRTDVHRVDFEGDNWQGKVITSLKEVPNLLE